MIGRVGQLCRAASVPGVLVSMIVLKELSIFGSSVSARRSLMSLTTNTARARALL